VTYLDYEPNPHSVEIMHYIDNLPKPFRDLMHEYGFKIVAEMIGDDYQDPIELADLLETWRCRRQEQWLETNYITRKTAQSIADAVQYRMTASACLKRM
jgi:hypothetical protein